MDKRKSKLITAKKKLLAYATLSTLGVSCITGCDETMPKDNCYTVSEDGSISFDGTVSYEYLTTFTPIKITGINDEESVYITYKEEYYGRTASQRILYIDILTNKEILDTVKTNLEFTELGNISDYLTSLKMIKAEYNQDDIEKLTTYIENSSEKETAKVKTKTTE